MGYVGIIWGGDGVRYYKRYENNELIAIGVGLDGTEITEEEYAHLLVEINTKVQLVEQLYSGEITISEVPEEWQEEIQRRVDERIAMQGTIDEQDIPAEEALNIILGGETA